MTTPSIGQPFPSIPAPFVHVIDAEGKVIGKGQIEQIWLQLLIALWNRTGHAAGVSSEAALIEAFLAQSEVPNEPNVALQTLLSSEGGAEKVSPLQAFVCEVVRVEIERLGLLCDSRDVASPLLAFLLASDDGGSSESEDDDSTSWVPAVTGAEPPVLLSDGAGHLVFVAWSP